MKAKNNDILYISMFLHLYLQRECYKRILNLTKILNRVMKMGIKSLLYGAAVLAVSATVASVTTYKVIESTISYPPSVTLENSILTTSAVNGTKIFRIRSAIAGRSASV